MGRLEGSAERIEEVAERAFAAVIEALTNAPIPAEMYANPRAQAFIRCVIAAAAPIIEDAVLDDVMADLEIEERHE